MTTDAINSMALFAKFNPEPVFRFDTEGLILEANPAANSSFEVEDITGWEAKRLISELNDIDIEEFITNDREQTITQDCGLRSYRFMLKGISELGICQIYGSDITAQLKAQREAESMALFAMMNPEPVFRVSRRGEIIQSNNAANTAFNITRTNKIFVSEIISQTRNLDFEDFIGDDRILTIIERFGPNIYRFMLRGIQKLGVC